jgi:hypothetical protein
MMRLSIPPYDYVRRYYGVDPVPGRRARFTPDGREGVIARRQSYDQYVWVKFDGEKHAMPCHPTDLDYAPAQSKEPAS